MTEPLIAELKAELAHIDNEIAALVARREAVAQLLRMYMDPPQDLGGNGERLTTVSMAEKALAKYGNPTGATELAKLIREMFGVKPAPSLQQILYNHARRHDRFYSDGNGRYGLLIWRNGKAQS